MKQLNRLGLISAISLIGNGLLPLPSFAAPRIEATTTPASVTTPHQMVEVHLRGVDGDRPLSNVQFQVEWQTPSKTPWLSTDFPLVEGTTLMNLEAIAPDGNLTLAERLPIRGNYTVTVTMQPVEPGEFAPIEQTLTIPVQEASSKYRNAAILALMLFGVGMGGGWIIGRRSQPEPGYVAARPVRLLLSGSAIVAIIALLIINIRAEQGGEHHHSNQSHEHSDLSLTGAESTAVQLRYTGEQIATVGEATPLAVEASSTNSTSLRDVALMIQGRSTEDNEPMFAYTLRPNEAGQVEWHQQFVDGAPHVLTIEAVSAATGQSLGAIAQPIEVEAVFPPLSVRLIGFAYLMGILALGMGTGFGVRQHWQHAPKPSLPSI